MALLPFSRGDVVAYHGSVEPCHGHLFRVESVVVHRPVGRPSVYRATLLPLEPGDPVLRNVRLSSFDALDADDPEVLDALLGHP